MSVVQQLHGLETLDTEIERFEGRVAEARRRLRENPELAHTEARLSGLRRQERETAAQLRSAEADLAALEANIARDERRLYGGQVVDARELGSLERELRHYRSRRDVAEETVLELMETLENLQADVASTRQRVDDLRSEWEAEQARLAAEIEEVTAAVAARRQQRATLVAALDPPILDLYSRVRARGGHALSPLADGVCGTCRVSLPPKDVQHARSGALVTCPNCSRILYAGR